MFGLLLFNAVILERRKFGPLGWNIPYQFTDSDRDVSVAQTEQLVNDYDVIPYTVITNITSEVNFGGRVTDKWDRRLIACQLLDFVNQGVEAVDYKFSPSGYYKSIAAVDKEGYLGMCMSIYMASLCACEWCLHVFPCTWCMCARVHGVCMRM